MQRDREQEEQRGDDQDAQERINPGVPGQFQGDVGAEHDQLAMHDVDQAHHAEHEREPEGRDGEDTAEQDAGEQRAEQVRAGGDSHPVSSPEVDAEAGGEVVLEEVARAHLHHPVGGQAARQHVEDVRRVDAELRAEHERLADAAMVIATTIWLHALTTWPAPLAPTCTMRLAEHLEAAAAPAPASAASPPTMMDRVALARAHVAAATRARPGIAPPRRPRGGQLAADRRVTPSLMSMSRRRAGRQARRLAPRTTARTAALVGQHRDHHVAALGATSAGLRRARRALGGQLVLCARCGCGPSGRGPAATQVARHRPAHHAQPDETDACHAPDRAPAARHAAPVARSSQPKILGDAAGRPVLQPDVAVVALRARWPSRNR